MLKKTPIQGSDRISVTFEIRPPADARTVYLAGDFNDWDPAATPMKRRKDGTWAATMRLARPRSYAYRFVVDGSHWLSDDQADSQAPDGHGSSNSVCYLS
jgi:1,4-alpha-glucan branching enzyme